MDVHYLFEKMGDNSFDVIYLNFSDPWPKARHARRRLTSTQFLAQYEKVLKKDGVVEFKTDAKIGAFLVREDFETENGCVSTYGSTTTWSTSTSYLHYQIDLSKLGNPKWITVKANARYTAYVALFCEKATSAHSSLTPPYAAGIDVQSVIKPGVTVTYDVPYDAKYLYVLAINSSNKDVFPEYIEYDCSNSSVN